MKLFRYLLYLGGLWAGSTAALAQPVVDWPANLEDFPARWEWALPAARDYSESQSWVAYEFTTTLDERINPEILPGFNNFLQWNNQQPGYGRGWRNGIATDSLIAGVDSIQLVPERVQTLIFIARFAGELLEEIRVVSPRSVVNWRHLPVFWAGSAGMAESYQALVELLDPTLEREQRRGLIRAIGLHDVNDRVGYLYSLFNSDTWSGDRPYILESLAIQAGDEAGNILMEVAGNANEAVAERRVAISALSRYPGARSLLMDLAGPLNPQQIRTEALESLGLFLGEDVDTLLMEIIASQSPVAVLGEAVQTIATRPQRFAYLEDLVREHTVRQVREEALQQLAYLDTRRAFTSMQWAAANDPVPANRREAIEHMRRVPAELAVPALFALVEDAAMPERLRREAVESLGRFNTETVRGGLNALAWSSASPALRAEAVESLGRLGDTPARALLLELARSHPSTETREEALEQLQEELF